MADSEFPAPQGGFVLTHLLVVSDQDRSREFYRSVFGATVVLERAPAAAQRGHGRPRRGRVAGRDRPDTPAPPCRHRRGVYEPSGIESAGRETAGQQVTAGSG